MSVAARVTAQPTSATIGSIAADGVRQLSAAGIDSAAQEIWWLLEHVLGAPPLSLRVQADRLLNPDEQAQITALVQRRVAREPLQYLLGTQEFCGRPFQVTPAVLIPRPETEGLVHAVRARLAESHRGLLVDVGTGSGCLAVTLALAYPASAVAAIDISPAALAVAKRNAAHHGVADRITWYEGDLLAPLAQADMRHAVSVIVANPPYIPDAELDRLQPEVARYEPRRALAGGVDGLAAYRRLIPDAVAYLAIGGILAMEVGMGQAQAIRQMVSESGHYDPAVILPDEAGIERLVIAVKRPREQRGTIDNG